MLGLFKSSRGLLKRWVLRGSKIELVFLPSFLLPIYTWKSLPGCLLCHSPSSLIPSSQNIPGRSKDRRNILEQNTKWRTGWCLRYLHGYLCWADVFPQEEAMPAFSNTRSTSCAVIQYAVNDLTIHISTGLWYYPSSPVVCLHE